MVTVGGGGGGGDLDPLVTLGVVVVARGLLSRPVGVGHGVGSEVRVTQVVETIEPGEVRVAGHPETDHHQLGLQAEGEVNTPVDHQHQSVLAVWPTRYLMILLTCVYVMDVCI